MHPPQKESGDHVAAAAAKSKPLKLDKNPEVSKDISVEQLAREYVLVAQVAAQAEQARKAARERLLTHIPGKYKGQGVTITRTHRWQLTEQGKEAMSRYRNTLVAQGMAEMIDSQTVTLWRKEGK